MKATIDKETKRVVIVGGGTAGWISACYLAKHLNSKAENSVKVTVIESEDIATIGVGEGTFPTIKTTLAFLGINEAEFLEQTDATFKQAIKFDHWLYTPGTSQHRNSYFHLFDVPKGAPNFDLSPYWLNKHHENACHFDEQTSAQTYLCRADLAPKKITQKAFHGLNYAYHLDAVKFARFLRDYAIKNLGVTHLVGTVSDVSLDKQGFIRALKSEQQGELIGDLFIDCSGFSALLIDKTYKIDFVDNSNVLFVNRAVTMQIPYQDEQCSIPSCTISTAHAAGWTWDIALTKRRGVGYVYSNAHCSDEQAEQTLRHYIGYQADQLTTRKISFQSGYREKQWHKNCVAIGLSAGFVEPLESSAIAMIELAAKFVAEEFPYSRAMMAISADKFNQAFSYRWQRIIDFIKLHYAISKRKDSEFWCDNREQSSIPQTLQDNLAKWALTPVTRNDFPSMYDLFGLESYQYVLYGMEYLPDIRHMQPALDQHCNIAHYLFNQVVQQRETLAQQMPSNRKLIMQAYQHGFSKL
ncbi:tryptophan halogenase family protein [Thalassotalea ganghwensis]